MSGNAFGYARMVVHPSQHCGELDVWLVQLIVTARVFVKDAHSFKGDAPTMFIKQSIARGFHLVVVLSQDPRKQSNRSTILAFLALTLPMILCGLTKSMQ